MALLSWRGVLPLPPLLARRCSPPSPYATVLLPSSLYASGGSTDDAPPPPPPDLAVAREDLATVAHREAEFDPGPDAGGSSNGSTWQGWIWPRRGRI